MPVCVPGFLTANAQLANGFADGYVLNQDGTANSAANPAAVGSNVTLTMTGIGAANPATQPGKLATSTVVTPDTAVYASWRSFSLGGANPPETVQWIPGGLDSVFQIRLAAPASVEIPGYALGNGVYRVPLGLRLQLPFSEEPPLASNWVGIYVK